MSFLDTWDTLHGYLLEVHGNEVETKHGGDEPQNGRAPETCSYCTVLEDHEKLTTQAAVPAGKQIECRGRNGWFYLQGAEVHWTYNTLEATPLRTNGKLLTIGFTSKLQPRDVAPIYFQGSPEAIEQLLLHLLLECGKVAAKMNEPTGVEA